MMCFKPVFHYFIVDRAKRSTWLELAAGNKFALKRSLRRSRNWKSVGRHQRSNGLRKWRRAVNAVRTLDGFLTTCPRIPWPVIFSYLCCASKGFRSESDKFVQIPFCPKTNPKSFSTRLCNREANRKIGSIDFSMEYLVFGQVIITVILRDSKN